MTSTYRGATRSVDFRLFQEFSTLDRQLAHTLSLRQGLSGVESMLPARSGERESPWRYLVPYSHRIGCPLMSVSVNLHAKSTGSPSDPEAYPRVSGSVSLPKSPG
jgi:hypothetical protein